MWPCNHISSILTLSYFIQLSHNKQFSAMHVNVVSIAGTVRKSPHAISTLKSSKRHFIHMHFSTTQKINSLADLTNRPKLQITSLWGEAASRFYFFTVTLRTFIKRSSRCFFTHSSVNISHSPTVCVMPEPFVWGKLVCDNLCHSYWSPCTDPLPQCLW